MSKTLNVALIGCGFFGSQLASAFYKAGANLIAVTDINPTLADKLAQQYQSCVFPSTEELLDKSKPDLVIIATPNYAHYSPAVLALNAGCDIFIETPFTLSTAHCQHLINLAKEQHRQIFIGYLERTLPGLLRVKQILDNRLLGQITVVRAVRQRWIENLSNKEWWKLDTNLTGGELFHLIHELDLLCWLVGNIQSVYAQSTNIAHKDTPDSHDVIQLLFHFKNGALGSLEMGTAYRQHQWEIQIHGEKGMIDINFFTSSVTFTYADGKTEHYDLYEEFEADLSLRDSSKGIQQYNQPHTLCPLWLSRAAEIEALDVVKHLRNETTSPLSQCIGDSIQIAEAAKYSMIVKERITLKN
ncbi:Gfo/Idh/MocA family protein [Rodentibacter haemolyticus]|uniref:Gfo/Idh/MocA family oxidoreductase n=1 Tax=Rodentibacter haemolyticus TaxID=2778911 RepID=A0ABX6UW96_9PAST|nr:Gfo/Idh/MocA family oxidoreductase [Rodentibacter haemolyticus]QPB42365.1 Gfo/Idh/MocA family oxidoreductase [Rodentibacter haemolyticus]